MPSSPARTTRSRFVALLGLLGLMSLGAACAPVAPYERGRLADPSMSPGFAESAANEHVQSVQEGAVGGKVGIGSGCGCN